MTESSDFIKAVSLRINNSPNTVELSGGESENVKNAVRNLAELRNYRVNEGQAKTRKRNSLRKMLKQTKKNRGRSSS